MSAPQQHEEDELLDEENPEDIEIIQPDDIEVEYDEDGMMDAGEDDDDDEDEEMGNGERGPRYGEAGAEAEEDNSIAHSTAHTSSLFTVSLHPLHPNPPLAISGGEDDMAYIFNTSTGETLLPLTGHTDSVICAAWSPDGNLAVTGGMDGKLRIWKRHGTENYDQWEFLDSLVGPDEITCMTFHPTAPILAVGSQDSTVWMFQLPKGTTMQVFAGHTDAITSVKFTPDGKRLLSTSQDASLFYWHPASPTPLAKFVPTDGRFELEGGITSLSIHPSSNLAVVGGASGGVRVVNLIKGEVLCALGGHKEDDSVEGLVFVDIAGNPVVCSAGTDGKILIWDVTTKRLRASVDHGEEAVTSLVLHPAKWGMDFLITSSSVDGTLKTFDVRTGNVLKVHKGHVGAVNGLDVGRGASEGKAVVVSAGDDGAALVFDV